EINTTVRFFQFIIQFFYTHKMQFTHTSLSLAVLNRKKQARFLKKYLAALASLILSLAKCQKTVSMLLNYQYDY
ncbi:hypothetical protein CN953_07650, partial [Bacillus thuringiensis]